MSVARIDTSSSLATGLDVSLGGIRFQCVGLDLEVGDVVRVGLTLEDQTFSVVGTLLRVTELDAFALEVALAFHEIDPDTQSLLEEILSPEDV